MFYIHKRLGTLHVIKQGSAVLLACGRVLHEGTGWLTIRSSGGRSARFVSAAFEHVSKQERRKWFVRVN